MSDSTDHNERVERVTKLLELLIAQMVSYHNHKETMAHAALLVALAVSATVMSTSSWPPSWVPALSNSSKEVAVLGVTVIWLVIHVYMRWQLRNRRVAAQYVVCLLKVLRNWANTPPNEADLQPYKGSAPGSSWFLPIVDLVVPLKRAVVPLDEGLQGYPTAVVTEYLRTSTADFWAEVLVSYGSIILWLLILARTLL